MQGISRFQGISKYRPQLFTPKNASMMNRQAVQATRDNVFAASEMFSSTLSGFGSGMVEITIKAATERIRAEATRKMEANRKATSTVDFKV